MTHLLPDGVDVSFDAIESAQAELAGANARALIATVVVVAPPDRLAEAGEALAELGGEAGVRTILIAEGTDRPARVRVASDAILLDGVRPEYVNNAVAALRLSSLPSLVWWRGGLPDALPGLAALADRLVLDAVDPSDIWPRVRALTEHTSVTDIRWARLTRWRSLMAHFFDMEDVRGVASEFRSLHIAGADAHAAMLFAGWLAASLPAGDDLQFTHTPAAGGATIESIALSAGALQLQLSVAPSRTCVVTSMQSGRGVPAFCRTASLGQQRLSGHIAQELRIRSRDVAFERAVNAIRRQP